MKKLLVIILLAIVNFSYGQKITTSAMDSALALPKNSRLFNNNIFSSSDTVLNKNGGAIYSRLSKFGGAKLFLNKIQGRYTGRIFSNTVYSELTYTDSGYYFISKDPRGLISNCPTDGGAIYKPVDVHSVPKPDYSNDLRNVTVNNYYCIFIDMDGQTVAGTSWNFSGPITAAPVSFSAYPDSMDFVISVVRELYSSFKVVVTRDSTIYFATNAFKRQRLIMTPTDQWYCFGHNCTGGVSFSGSTAWGDGTPNWVFWGPGISMAYMSAILAAAHEPGHAIASFYHQANFSGCTRLAEYNPGYGSGESSIGIIMGNPYTPNSPIWWSGNTLDCAHPQDDFAVLTSIFGLVSDDIGNTIRSARVIVPGIQVTGQISNGENDYYKIQVDTTGAYTFSAEPRSFGANHLKAPLRMKLKLYQRNGTTLIDSSTNSSTLNGTISSVSLTAGKIYYLKVTRNTHANNPTGYGFNGHYTLIYNKN